MPSLFANLQINRVAVHEVLRRETDLEPLAPRCSDCLADLGHDGLFALRERVVKAMGSDSKSIEMSIRDDSANSAFSLCCKMITASDDQFLSLSTQLTQKLAGIQSSRTIPGGVVVVLNGTIGVKPLPFAGIIKAEIHNGFIREQRDSGPFIRFLNDLLLTPQQKLHKIGLFIQNNIESDADDEYPVDDFMAYVFDNQMSSSEITTAANYFYEQFLGCTAAQSSRKLTRDFYNHSHAFITNSDLDEDDKIGCITALHTYLRSNNPTIHAGDFATDHLPPAFHQAFTNHIEQMGFPSTAIMKDTTSIKRKLKTRKLSFTSDVRIIAPADNFGDLVSVQSADNGTTIVHIKGRLANQD